MSRGWENCHEPIPADEVRRAYACERQCDCCNGPFETLFRVGRDMLCGVCADRETRCVGCDQARAIEGGDLCELCDARERYWDSRASARKDGDL